MLGAFKMVTGFFIGENSKKRIMGIVAFILLTIAMQLSYITTDLYLLAIPLLSAFSGIANNAKFAKMGKEFAKKHDEMEKLVKEAKPKK